MKIHAGVRHSARSARIGFCFMADLLHTHP